MNRLSVQTQMYILIAVIALVTVGVVFLVIVPMMQEAATLDSQIATEQGNLATAQALVARRQSAKAQSAANEVELMRIANQVPDSPQLPSLIIEVQDVANAAGVDLPQIQVGDVAPAAPGPDGVVRQFSTLQITVRVTGEWPNVIDFDRRLSKLDRGVRVVTSTFTYMPETEEEEDYVEATSVLEVYVMAAATTDAAPATAVTTGQ
jgi:Tfp pilus assembly protein PilO